MITFTPDKDNTDIELFLDPSKWKGPLFYYDVSTDKYIIVIAGNRYQYDYGEFNDFINTTRKYTGTI